MTIRLVMIIVRITRDNDFDNKNYNSQNKNHNDTHHSFTNTKETTTQTTTEKKTHTTYIVKRLPEKKKVIK